MNMSGAGIEMNKEQKMEEMISALAETMAVAIPTAKYLVLITGRTKTYVLRSERGIPYPIVYPFTSLELAIMFASATEELFPDLRCTIFKLLERPIRQKL